MRVAAQGKNVVKQPSPKAGRRGPDAKVVEDGKIIWLEAYAATHGTGANAVPRYDIPSDGTVRVQRVPDDEMVLRDTAAMKEKIAKYERYAGGNPVGNGDVCAIAISAGGLDHRYTEMLYPRILHALFPIGNYAVTIDVKTMQTTREGHQYRERVGPVETSFFATPRHALISTVAYACAGTHIRKQTSNMVQGSSTRWRQSRCTISG